MEVFVLTWLPPESCRMVAERQIGRSADGIEFRMSGIHRKILDHRDELPGLIYQHLQDYLTKLLLTPSAAQSSFN